MSEKPTIKIVNKKGIRGRENKRFLTPTYPKIPQKQKNRRAKTAKTP
ncbi:hypothetical protein E5K48_04265 [Helicobacter pylori]|nr:hypothetical protein E5K48_04265 [Helicobacter pylori]